MLLTQKVSIAIQLGVVKLLGTLPDDVNDHEFYGPCMYIAYLHTTVVSVTFRN